MDPIAPDDPQEGTFKTRLVRGGVFVAVRIWWGPPVMDGEEQDRSPRWNVEVDGSTTHIEKGDDGYRCTVYHDVHRYWPYVAKHPIEEWEYRLLKDKSAWAKQYAPDRPEASPHEKVDWQARRPIF